MNLDIKIATRESYGKKLVELGKTNKDIVVLDADLEKQHYLKKNFQNVFLTWEFQNKI